MTNREQMIQELKERLQWLEGDEAGEENGREEAAAIERLLQVMEQPLEATGQPQQSMEGSSEVVGQPLQSLGQLSEIAEQPLQSMEGSSEVAEQSSQSLGQLSEIAERPLQSLEGFSEVAEQSPQIMEQPPEPSGEKEWNAKELNVKELNMEEGYYSTEAAMGRFWKTYDTRAAIDVEREKLLNGKPSKKKRQNIFLYFAGHRGVAVAAVVGLLILGLFVGAVGSYAVQGMEGNFFWMKNGEEGLSGMVLMNEELGNKEEVVEEGEYNGIDEIPKEYADLCVLPDSLGKDYELEKIKVWNMNRFVLYKAIYYNATDMEIIECFQQYYREGLIYFNDVYVNYDFEKKELIDALEVSFYKRNDLDGSKRIVDFQMDKNVFAVQSYLELEELDEIVESLIKNIKK